MVEIFGMTDLSAEECHRHWRYGVYWGHCRDEPLVDWFDGKKVGGLAFKSRDKASVFENAIAKMQSRA